MNYDYIIVGAGSAGCVLANRLSQSGRHTVLVLEAGGSDRRFWIHAPIGYGRTFFDERVNWKYLTEPDPGTHNRQGYWPRGKVLGGSSSINAMVYIRGQKQDFDGWARHGNPGWDWSGVLPYFKKLEGMKHGDPGLQGIDGPLKVADVSGRTHPICRHFLAAGVELGIPFNADFNGAQQEGVGYYQVTMSRARRMSAARAYLRPAMGRSNLDVISHALATRILFENKHAVGVEFNFKGRLRSARASREVILSAGAINSPQLLQLSGIADPALLSGLGVEVVYANRMVGQNMQDHLGVDYVYLSRVPTLNDALHHWYGKLWAGMKYVFAGSGPLSLGINQAGGFFRTRQDLARPNMQLFFWPLSYLQAPAGTRPLINPDPYSGFSLGIQPLQPASRGHLTIDSADPARPPKIYPNYLSSAKDLSEMLEGVKFIRKFAQTSALSRVIAKELMPGPAVSSDEQLMDHFRRTCTTVFHPSGTCRMGDDKNTNVVNAKLQVHGVDGLRVVDASVFPTVTSGNTNAPTIMVAEKAADIILG